MKRTQKFNEIQVFRGLAAFIVVLLHATLIGRKYFLHDFAGGAFSFGYSGVDFFFVLSGFIIAYVHLGDIGREKAIFPYLKKRIVRIYPIYWAITLLLLPIYFLKSDFGYGFETRPSAIASSLLLFPQTHSPILGVAWSLCHEVKFYALFALAIFMGRKAAIGMVAAVALFSAFLYALDLCGIRPVRFDTGLDFVFSRYNLEFGAGCLCAYLAIRGKISGPGWWRGAGALLFVVSACFNPYLSVIQKHHSILTFGLASAFLIAGSAGKEIARPASAPRALIFLGNASYSIYLVHYPVLSLLGKVLGGLHVPRFLGGTLTSLLTIILAIGAGCLVHVALEKPMLAFFGGSKRQKRVAEKPQDAVPGLSALQPGLEHKNAPER